MPHPATPGTCLGRDLARQRPRRCCTLNGRQGWATVSGTQQPRLASLRFCVVKGRSASYHHSMNFSDAAMMSGVEPDGLVTISYVLPASLAAAFQRETTPVLDRLYRATATADFDLAAWDSSEFVPPYNSNHRGDESAWDFPPITADDIKPVAWVVDNWTDTGRALAAGLLLAPAGGIHTFDLAEKVGYTGGLPSAFPRSPVAFVRSSERHSGPETWKPPDTNAASDSARTAAPMSSDTCLKFDTLTCSRHSKGGADASATTHPGLSTLCHRGLREPRVDRTRPLAVPLQSRSTACRP